MLSQKLLAIIDKRCKQATGLMIVPFGGIHVILTGDPGQLLPVCTSFIYKYILNYI